MPFNGSGTYNRLYSWVVDAANSVNISSSRTDAEMNGFAAGLTNCITRDGQSPPSADTPWGGKKITNLGLASTGTDALSQNAGDARYTQTSALSGYLLLTGGTISGAMNFNGAVNINSGGTLKVTAPSTTGFNAGIAALATDHARVESNGTGAAAILFNRSGGGLNAYLGIDTDNVWKIGGGGMGANAYKIWHGGSLDAAALNTIYGYAPTSPAALASALSPYAPLASPTFTGTPAASTASSGTATTQLATTAFVDGLRDVPSNAQTANYALALTDRGKGVDFNGTSLTCTVPANASVAFPVGSVVVLTNLNSTALSIAITTDTLTLSGTTTTGTRTLGQNGEARLRKVTATSWLIAGTNLS